jgi:hypothetical protein
MGLNINIVTKHDPYHNRNYYFLHEDLDYSQRTLLFLTIKDVQNQN